MSEKLNKRKQQAMSTRKKILNCALDLFEKKGYDEVTIQEIAVAAQTSVGSIYRYFKDKEEIAAQSTEPLDDIYSAYFENLMSAEEYREMKAIEKLENFYLFVQKAASSYSNLQSLYVYYLRHPENNIFLTAESRELYCDYHLLLDECRKEGSIIEEVSDEEYFDLLIQSSRGMLIDWLFRNKSFDFEKRAGKWWSVIYSAFRGGL